MDYSLYFFGWVFLLVVLNVADAILTVRILGGGGRELNPIMAAAMRVVGVKPALLLRLFMGRRIRPMLWLAYACFTSLLFGIIGDNTPRTRNEKRAAE